MKALLLTAAALSAATAIGATAVAQDSSPAAATPAATPAPAPASKKDPNGRVCKTTPVIGSRVPTRVCMTRAEWEQRARDARQQVDDSQRSGLTTCATNPCGG